MTNYIRGGCGDVGGLLEKAQALRARLTDTDFDRLKCDSNADYIKRCADVVSAMDWPKADMLPGAKGVLLNLNGVKVPVEINFRLRRLTKTNVTKEGFAALRYLKGKPLKVEHGAWHAAILFGAMHEAGSIDGGEPEHKLCLAVDVWAGVAHPAPTDAITRFKNAKAACAGIAERWPNIKPPLGAVF